MFKNFCRFDAAVSDLYNGKSKNKIAIIFFSLFPWLRIRAGGIWTRVGGLYKIPLRGGNRTKGRGHKDFKRGGRQTGSRRDLKPPYEL